MKLEDQNRDQWEIDKSNAMRLNQATAERMAAEKAERNAQLIQNDPHKALLQYYDRCSIRGQELAMKMIAGIASLSEFKL